MGAGGRDEARARGWGRCGAVGGGGVGGGAEGGPLPGEGVIWEINDSRFTGADSSSKGKAHSP